MSGSQEAVRGEVLHVIGASKYGGVYEVVFELCEMARQHGFAPTILTTDPRGIEEAQSRGITVVAFTGIDRPVRPWKDFVDAWRLSRLLRDRRPSLVHTHTTKGGLVGRLACKWSGVGMKVVHTHHGLPFREDSHPLFRRFAISVEKAASRWCDRLILMNEHDMASATATGIATKEQIRYVPNGIADPRTGPSIGQDRDEVLRGVGVEPAELVVGNICRLSDQKNLTQFLESLALLDAVGDRRVVGLLVGDGPRRELLEAEAARLGLGSRIRFLGFRSDRLQLLAAFDVFLTTSRYEGMSISLLEAMALAKPIVATDVRGNHDCIRDGHEGRLVPIDESRPTARACEELLSNPTRAEDLGRRARERFETEFTRESLRALTWDRVYALLLGSQGDE